MNLSEYQMECSRALSDIDEISDQYRTVRDVLDRSDGKLPEGTEAELVIHIPDREPIYLPMAQADVVDKQMLRQLLNTLGEDLVQRWNSLAQHSAAAAKQANASLTIFQEQMAQTAGGPSPAATKA